MGLSDGFTTCGAARASGGGDGGLVRDGDSIDFTTAAGVGAATEGLEGEKKRLNNASKALSIAAPAVLRSIGGFEQQLRLDYVKPRFTSYLLRALLLSGVE